MHYLHVFSFYACATSCEQTHAKAMSLGTVPTLGQLVPADPSIGLEGSEGKLVASS